MLPGAGGCRAIGVIATVMVFASSALAQDDAARLVDQFARDAQHAEARKAEAGRKAAAAPGKQEVQKDKSSELRKRAQAQHAEAVARRKAAETRATEEAQMQERARQEAEEQKATAEIRDLIREAEAARMRAEAMLPAPPESAEARPSHIEAPHDTERRARETQAAETRAAEGARAAAVRVSDHKRRVSTFARARQLRNARMGAHARRLAEEREAQRLRDETRKAALARAEAHRTRAKLARVAEARRARARAQAAARAEAERALAVAMAAEQAQRAVETQARAEAERRQRAAAEQARLDAERQARAEAERTQRMAGQAQRTAELQARAEAERRQRAAAEQARLEAEQQARAEAEHAQRLAEQARLDAERQARAETERIQRMAEQASLEEEAQARAEAERIRLAEQARKKEEAKDNSPARETTAVESKALSPPEFQVAAEPGLRMPTNPSRLGGPPETVADSGDMPPRHAPEWNGQVTVLMVMAPGTYGIRRGSRTADPLLCTVDGCYISTGSDMAALFKPRRKALGIGNTLGRRAGACRRQLGCIFRAVAFDFPGMLQPVDLHILKHDRRRPQVVIADSNCRVATGQLACRRPILGDDYVMWVLPEWLADRAGPDLLERALRTGLSPVRSADAYTPR